MSKIRIDADLCVACRRCVACCPAVIFSAASAEGPPKTDHESFCIACGHCVALCASGAITHGQSAPGRVEAIREALLPSADQVLEMIRARRSVRVFKEEPIERALLERIIDGARFAPSAHNSQSTEFVVVQEKAVLKQIVELTGEYFAKVVRQLRNPIKRRVLLLFARREVEGAIDFLPELEMLVQAVRGGKDMILHDAPAVVLFHADRHAGFADVNAGLSLANAMYVAQGLGLGSFWLGFVVAACKRDGRIPRLLSIPENHCIYGGLAVGHPRFRYAKWIERNAPRVRWM